MVEITAPRLTHGNIPMKQTLTSVLLAMQQADIPGATSIAPFITGRDQIRRTVESMLACLTASGVQGLPTKLGTRSSIRDAVGLLYNAVVDLPWYLLGRLEGFGPALWLDFGNNRYAVNGVSRNFSDLFTISRNSIGTYIDIAGNIQTAAAHVARFTHDPVTHAPLGLMIEPQRRNDFLNSATGVTQNITTAATTYTLSFYGTGTITLSGTATGSLTGSGAYPSRSVLTFTATAGTLTLTVSGSCTMVQCEAGVDATSYIPTTGAAVTRLTDNIINNNSNVVPFSSWYNPLGGTLSAKYVPRSKTTTTSRSVLVLSDGTTQNRLVLHPFATPNVTGGGVNIFSGNVSQYAGVDVGTETLNVDNAQALTFAASNFQHCVNGSLAAEYTYAAALPVSPTTLHLGVSTAGNSEVLNGTLKEIRYYTNRVSKPNLIRLCSSSEIGNGFGDSITVGYNASTVAAKWLNIVAAALGVKPVNKGISSTTLQNTPYTTTGLPGVSNGRDRYLADLTGANKAEWAFILYGVNDIRLSNTSEPSLTVALYQNDLKEIVLGLIAEGYSPSKIIVGSPAYFINGDDPVRHAAIAAAARQVAVETRVKYAGVYEYMSANGGASLVSGDQLHPNDAGHAAIAVAMLAADYVS